MLNSYTECTVDWSTDMSTSTARVGACIVKNNIEIYSCFGRPSGCFFKLVDLLLSCNILRYSSENSSSVGLQFAMAAGDQSKPEAANSMSIKLMLDKRCRKILYAEAGKDFVDLLFSFLVLPAGAIAKKTLDSKATKSEEQKKVSCITNLYNSVENLSGSLMKADKAALLDPKVVSTTYTNDLLQIQSPPPSCPPGPPPKYYVCYNAGSSSYMHSLSTQCGTVTCACGHSVNREVKLVDKPPVAAKDPVPTGYVKKSANFVITDDLSVMPIDSTATIVKLWNKLDLQEPTELQERNVTVGADEVLGLLKAALVSNTALNDVFTGKPKQSTPLDSETTRLAVQDLLLKLLVDNQKYRSGKVPT